MKQRGRKSAAALSVVTAVPGSRPEPPEDMNDEQAEVWRAVVSTKPADWFTDDTFPLLSAYCKHVTTHRILDAQVDAFDPEWLKDSDGPGRYKALLDMREKETRALMALARSMRLTHQSRWQPKTAGTKASAPARKKPWEA